MQLSVPSMPPDIAVAPAGTNAALRQRRSRRRRVHERGVRSRDARARSRRSVRTSASENESPIGQHDRLEGSLALQAKQPGQVLRSGAITSEFRHAARR